MATCPLCFREQHPGRYCFDAPEPRICAHCGDGVQYLSSDDLCDGCVAEGRPVTSVDVDALREAIAWHIREFVHERGEELVPTYGQFANALLAGPLAPLLAAAEGASLRDIAAVVGLSNPGVLRVIRRIEAEHITPASGDEDEPDNLVILTTEENERLGRDS